MLPSKRALALSAVLLTASVLVGCSGEERQAKYLARAQEHFDAGNIEKARVDAKNVLQINEKHADARYLLALIEERDGNWPTAIGNLNEAIEINPNHVDANVKLGTVNMLLKEFDKAQEYADLAVSLEPDNADALALKAALILRDENREEAEALVTRALAIDSANTAAITVYAAIHGADSPEDALAVVDTGLSQDPKNFALRRLKIRLLQSMGETELVIAELQWFIADDPESTTNIGQLADYYSRNDRLTEAEGLLREKIEELPENTQLKLFLLRLIRSDRGVEQAIVEVGEMLTASPEEFVVRNSLGQLLVANEEYERAQSVWQGTFEHDVSGASSQSARINLARLANLQDDRETMDKWLNETLEVEPENPDALLMRATNKLKDNDVKGAIPDLRMVLRSNPDSVPALLLLADAQQKDRSVSLALDNYRKVIAIEPGNTVALFQSARILVIQENYDDAASNLETILREDSSSLQVVNMLVDVYSRQERWEEAEALTMSLESDAGTQPVADIMNATLALRQGNNEEALKLAKKALAENEDLISGVLLAAQAYTAMENIDAAIVFVSDYIEKHSANAVLLDLQARLFLAANQTENAVEAYSKVIETSPDRVGAYVSLARIYWATDRAERVIPLYEQGLAANPENMLLHSELALLYQGKGELDKALELLNKAYEIDPDSELIVNNLAVMLIERYPTEENLRKAQKMTLGFEESDSAPQIDTLGWLHYRLGNYQQSIRLLEKAQKLGGRGADYSYHLGMAYFQNNQLDLAKEQLELALSNPAAQFVGKDEAEETLSRL